MGKEYNISTLLSGHVLPPLPPFPDVPVHQIAMTDSAYSASTVEGDAGDKIEQTVFGTPMVMPLKLKLKSESDFWLIPVEPLISIDGKNILIRRNVAKKKGSGSIKEYWTQDDWTINIQGLLTTPGSEKFPDADLKQLEKYCTAKEPLDVLCPGLERLGISKIVIETYSLPFTKGPENQNYSITAYSDTEWDLLIKKSGNVL